MITETCPGRILVVFVLGMWVAVKIIIFDNKKEKEKKRRRKEKVFISHCFDLDMYFNKSHFCPIKTLDMLSISLLLVYHYLWCMRSHEAGTCIYLTLKGRV